jgi:hypothetical protein
MTLMCLLVFFSVLLFRAVLNIAFQCGTCPPYLDLGIILFFKKNNPHSFVSLEKYNIQS